MAKGSIPVASLAPADLDRKVRGYDAGVPFETSDIGHPRDERGVPRHGSVPSGFSGLEGGRSVAVPLAEGR